MTVVRYILTGILLYCVYEETGWATTLFSTLVAVRSEIDFLVMEKLTKIS